MLSKLSLENGKPKEEVTSRIVNCYYKENVVARIDVDPMWPNTKSKLNYIKESLVEPLNNYLKIKVEQDKINSRFSYLFFI
jgi:hypothetical protein